MELSGLATKSLEWNLNDWRWDGNLFLANPLNAAPPECRNNRSPPCSDETDFGITEKRQRVVVVDEDERYDAIGSLGLKLGGNAYPIAEADFANLEERNGKRSRLQGGNPSRSACQVEGCEADLSGCKDYHRRHRVCELHSKASRALVGNFMQRFCQQCSRFHLLQEFDEGKRSCRRRLAGHNKRRRKTHPEVTVSRDPSTDDLSSMYLLISLLRILTNLHTDSSDLSKDQEFLSHILRNLASLAGSFDAKNISRLLKSSQDQQKLGVSTGTSSEAANGLLSVGVTSQELARPISSTSKVTCMTGTQGPTLRSTDRTVSVGVARVEMPSKRNIMEASLGETLQAVLSQISGVPADVLSTKSWSLCSLQCMLPAESTVDRVRLKDFDLNSAYSDTENFGEQFGKSATPAYVGTGSPSCPSWLLQDFHQSSPPQTSVISDTTSSQSLSSSNGDAQSRTDKIVFKLFGKDPNDFPLVLRAQILDWLSHSPTEIESYIRPGCIILTIYLRLAQSAWEELCSDLRSSLNRLLYNSSDDFWKRGWVYARVQHHMAFIYNGQVVLDAPLLFKSHNRCKILCVTPIAASVSARVNFTVKGFNLAQPTVRLLCAFEGMYLVQETARVLAEGTDNGREDELSQCLSFSCSLPNATGRGFIEVEDLGLSSVFFPFIVADEDVCLEIRMLENAINVALCGADVQEKMAAMIARDQALDFLHEIGWLLRRSHLQSREQTNCCPDVFSLSRFRWLMQFAMDRAWCAVVKKLLDLLFHKTIDIGGHFPVELALSEDLLHNAVQKKCKSIVELLLRYRPDTASKETGHDSFLFRPDMLGSSNLTPLHVAASTSGAECVLDALTDDPAQLGIKAWNSVRDSTGLTPEDYARSRGHESYINLVQKKISKQLEKAHVALDILGSLSAPDAIHKQSDVPNSGRLAGFEIGKGKSIPARQQYCNLCSRQLAYRSPVRSSLLHRPMMLSMVGIAAVCVCVGLLLKGPPQVHFVYPSFRWELLCYGTI